MNNYNLEGNIEWKITENGRFVSIEVKTIDNLKYKQIIYECMYVPIFGYDVDDIANINLILDEWITKFKS